MLFCLISQWKTYEFCFSVTVRIPARLPPGHLSKNNTISFIKVSQIYHFLVRSGLAPFWPSTNHSQVASQSASYAARRARRACRRPQGRREAWRALPVQCLLPQQYHPREAARRMGCDLRSRFPFPCQTGFFQKRFVCVHIRKLRPRKGSPRQA